MAMINVGEYLKEQLRLSSPEAQREGDLATAIFADRVDRVAEGGIDKYQESAVETSKAVAEDLMTPNQQLDILESRKLLRDAKVGFAVRYFGR